MLEHVLGFWGILGLGIFIYLFIWLTKELPNCIHLVRNNIDESAIFGILLWIVCLIIFSILGGLVYDSYF